MHIWQIKREVNVYVLGSCGMSDKNPSSSAKYIAKCLEIRNIRVKKGLLNAHLYVYLSLPKHSDTLVHNDISLMEIHDCIIIISA